MLDNCCPARTKNDQNSAWKNRAPALNCAILRSTGGTVTMPLTRDRLPMLTRTLARIEGDYQIGNLRLASEFEQFRRAGQLKPERIVSRSTLDRVKAGATNLKIPPLARF